MRWVFLLVPVQAQAYIPSQSFWASFRIIHQHKNQGEHGESYRGIRGLQRAWQSSKGGIRRSYFGASSSYANFILLNRCYSPHFFTLQPTPLKQSPRRDRVAAAFESLILQGHHNSHFALLWILRLNVVLWPYCDFDKVFSPRESL